MLREMTRPVKHKPCALKSRRFQGFDGNKTGTIPLITAYSVDLLFLWMDQMLHARYNHRANIRS
jgi:hypothetical protein